MRDPECVQLLQAVFPRMRLRWEGFRRVRGQVCKRVARRIAALGLDGADGYRRFLDQHPEELALLDGLCRVSVSRFYRDRAVFDALRDELIPRLAVEARDRGESRLRAFSAGCAGGEEPYTLALIWQQAVGPRFPELELEVVASDADPVALERARRACYRGSSLKELPRPWREAGFVPRGDLLCVADDVRARVELRCEDIRVAVPEGPFHLVLCRNVGFTYFAVPVQEELLARLVERLAPGGALIIGAHERLPQLPATLVGHGRVPGIFNDRRGNAAYNNAAASAARPQR